MSVGKGKFIPKTRACPCMGKGLIGTPSVMKKHYGIRCVCCSCGRLAFAGLADAVIAKRNSILKKQREVYSVTARRRNQLLLRTTKQ